MKSPSCRIGGMAKPKRPRDPNSLAFAIVAEATGAAQPSPDLDAGKDPAAVARGRKGGLSGGKNRFAKLSAEERKQLALKAAQARWSKAKKA